MSSGNPRAKPPVRKPGEGVGTRKRSRTDKQIKFIKYYLETSNATQSAIRAGYSERTASSIAHKLLRNAEILKPIDRALQKVGIDEDLIAQETKKGIGALETKFFQKDGKIEEEREVIPWGTRLDYLQFAAKMKGLLKEKVEIEPGDKPIEIRIVKRVARSKKDD